MIKRSDTSKNNNPEKTFCMKVSFGVKDYDNFSDILVNTIKRDHNSENKTPGSISKTTDYIQTVEFNVC